MRSHPHGRHRLAQGSAAIALLLALAWSVGAVIFLRADGSFSWRLPQTANAEAGEHNLVSYKLGPILRASSYYRDVRKQHHPAFLVDGREHPSLLEKWVSNREDHKPWIELRWNEPRLLSRVKIWHAGYMEAEKLTVRNYRLRCISDAPEPVTLEVKDNESAIAEHTLHCPNALGVRIDWQRNQGKDRLVRVYEIEAWGR